MNSKLLGNLALILFVLFLVISAFVAGSFLNTYLSKKSINPFSQSSVNTKPNSLFTSQIATIQGKITATGDRELMVENNNGTSAKLSLGTGFLIFKIPANGIVATPSADLKEIDIDREATIGLSALGDDFEITSVYYYETPSLPDIPSSPDTSSGTASPENP